MTENKRFFIADSFDGHNNIHIMDSQSDLAIHISELMFEEDFGNLLKLLNELNDENEELKSLFKSKGVQLVKAMDLLVSKEYAQLFIILQDVLYDLSERGLIK